MAKVIDMHTGTENLRLGINKAVKQHHEAMVAAGLVDKIATDTGTIYAWYISTVGWNGVKLSKDMRQRAFVQQLPDVLTVLARLNSQF